MSVLTALLMAVLLLCIPNTLAQPNTWTQLYTNNPTASTRPSPRSGIVSGIYNGNMYMYGGGPGVQSADVWSFPVSTTVPPDVSPPFTRHTPTIASSLTSVPAASDGHVGVVTGNTLMSQTVQDSSVAGFLNLDTMVWRRASDLPLPLSDSALAYTSSTSGVAHLVAGRTPLGTPIDTIYEYNIDADTGPGSGAYSFIDRVGGQTWMERRFLHSAVHCNSSLYVFGGKVFGSPQLPTNDLWRLDLTTNTMELVFNPLSNIPSARAGAVLACAEPYMYLFGGFDDSSATTVYYSDVWRFSFATAIWTQLGDASSASGPWPSARASPACSVSTLYLYCYGGFSGSANSNELWAYQYTRNGPSISAFVANDPDDLDDVYSVADTLTLTFSEPTNQPAVATAADIDALLSFSFSLGTNYTGVWVTPDSLVITVNDPTGATGLSQPPIGITTVTVLAAGGLRSTDETTLASTATSPALSGDWGIPPGPTIISFIADDPDDADGVLSNGDILIIEFSEPTSQPPIATKAELDLQLSFSGSLGSQYSAAWTSSTTLRISLDDVAGAALTLGVSTVRCSGNITNDQATSLPCDSLSPVLVGDFGLLPGPSLVSLTADDPDDADGIYSSGDTLTLTFSEATNTPPVATLANLNDLIAFWPLSPPPPSPPQLALGLGATGSWTSPTTLVITITDTASSSSLISDLAFTAQILDSAPAPLRNAAATSVPSSSVSPPVTGDWGLYPGPYIVSLTANDPDDADALYSAGDTVALNFSVPTTTPTIATAADIDALFTFSAPLGLDYTGVWVTSSLALLTVVTPSTPPTLFPEIGVWNVTVAPAADLWSLPPTAARATGTSPPLDGDWGTLAGPSIVSIVANDPDDADAVFSSGDTVTITFSEATSQPPIASPSAFDAMFAFSNTASLGSSYTATWSSPGVAVLTILAGPADPSLGPVLSLSTLSVVGDLTNAAGTSLPSRAPSPPLAGDWGLLAGPTIVGFLADDPDNLDGFFSTGDTLTISFSQATNTPTVITRTDINALLQFSQSLGASYTGVWSSSSSLVITVLDAQGAAPPAIGVLTVTVIGDLRDASSRSLPSTDASDPIVGDWGNGPTCNFATCDACSSSPQCGWCAATGTCQVGSTIGPLYGACPAWQFDTCVSCNASSCSSCLANPDCGFCASGTPSAPVYTCDFGSVAGPYMANCSGVWHSGTCPGASLASPAPPLPLQVSESGATAPFSLVLDAQPLSPVVVMLGVSDTTEGQVSPDFLVFGPTDWNVAQGATLVPVNDDVDDGNIDFDITLGPFISDDRSFSDTVDDSIPAVNLDDDTAGLHLDYSTGSPRNTSESPTSSSVFLSLALTSQPTDLVSVYVQVSNTGEGAITSPALPIVFSPSSWSSPVTVTVQGVDDDIDDGPVAYTVTAATLAGSTTDAKYSLIQSLPVTLYNEDDDTAGVIVSSVSNMVSESGTTATFTVRLASQPTVSVTSFPLVSQDTSEVDLAPGEASLLVFSPADWNLDQTVTLVGVDDPVADGDQTSVFAVGPGVSGDPNYETLSGFTSVVTLDDDVLEVRVSSVTGQVSEDGGIGVFWVTLGSMPTANVSIGVQSSDTTEGTVSPSVVTIAPAQWSTGVQVSIQGVDDLITDGDVTFAILFDVAVSADPAYNGLSTGSLNVINYDNDIPGIFVTAPSGFTSESGTSATIQVSLLAAPASSVTVSISSSDTGEAVVSPSSLVFSVLDWSSPRMVTMVGVDDLFPDGNQVYQIVLVSSSVADPAYQGIRAEVNNTNIDDDVAGLVVTPLSTPALTTQETAGATSFTVVGLSLSSTPLSPVNVSIVSTDPSEGVPSVSWIVLDPATWSTPVPFSVYGQDDFVDDGSVEYEMTFGPTTSDDPLFAGLFSSALLTNDDDGDTAGLTVTPLTTVPMTVSETGTVVSFTVALSSQPVGSGTVEVPLSVTDVSEGLVSPSSLTFTASSWNIPVTCTLTGVDDPFADGDVNYQVVVGATSATTDPLYAGIQTQVAALTTEDTDAVGVNVVVVSAVTHEAFGVGDASFTFALTSQPFFEVVVSITSSDETEGLVVDPVSGAPGPERIVRIAPSAWATPITVVFRGVDDDEADGDIGYDAVLGPLVSGDAAYNGYSPVTVPLVNINDDEAKVFAYAPAGEGTVYEVDALNGVSAVNDVHVSVVLTSQPSADVSVPVSLRPGTEAYMVDDLGGVLVFTPSTFNVPQTLRVGALDEAVIDGAQIAVLDFGPIVSADVIYAGQTSNYTVVNIDNEDAALILVNPGGVIGNTTEAGGTSTAAFVLGGPPTSNVAFDVHLYTRAATESTPEAEVVSSSTLVFTPANWATPQSVVIQGNDDGAPDGDAPMQLVVGGGVTSDSRYYGVYAGPYTIYNVDDDTVAYTITGADPLVVFEAPSVSGGVISFGVSLASQPSASVTTSVQVSGSRADTGALTVTTPPLGALTFTPASWSTPQTVTLMVADDGVVNAFGLDRFTVAIGPATTGDAGYASLAPLLLSGFVVDDEGDSVLVVSEPTPGTTTSETGDAVTFFAFPRAPLTLGVGVSGTAVSSDTSEGQVTTGSSFGFALGSGPAAVVVTGVDDASADGDVAYTVTVAASGGVVDSSPATVALTNMDVGEAAEILVRDGAGLVTSEAGVADRFFVSLGAEPTDTVRVSFAADPVDEVTVSPSSVLFTPLSWHIEVEVVVVGVADGEDDGDVSFTIAVGPAVSNDAAFGGLGLSSGATVGGINYDVGNPVIVSMAPEVVGLEGGVVTLEGSGFDASGVTVWLNGTETAWDGAMALDVSLLGTTHILFRAPERDSGASMWVRVVNGDGSTATAATPLLYSGDCPQAGVVGFGDACVACPDGAVCPGGNRIIPLPGYWSPGEGSQVVIACHARLRCLGGPGSGCAAGYTGFACGSCADGYALDGDACVECTSKGVRALYWLMYVGVAGGLLGCLAWAQDPLVASHLVWIFVVFGWLRGAASTGSERVPEFVRGYYHFLGLFTLDVEFLRVGCDDDRSRTFESVFFGTFVMAVVVCGAGAMGTFVVNRGSGRALDKVIRTLTGVVLVVFPTMVKVSVQGVTCAPGLGTHWLVAHASQECFSGVHGVEFLFAMIGWVGCVAVPCLVVWVYLRDGTGVLSQIDMLGRYGILYELTDYEDWHWLAVIVLGVQGALGLAGYMFVRVPVVAFVVGEVALLSLCGVMMVSPLEARWHSVWAGLVAAVSLVIVVYNFIADEVFESSVSMTTLDGLGVLVVASGVGSQVAYIVWLFFHARSTAWGQTRAAHRIAFARKHEGETETKVELDGETGINGAGGGGDSAIVIAMPPVTTQPVVPVASVNDAGVVDIVPRSSAEHDDDDFVYSYSYSEEWSTSGPRSACSARSGDLNDVAVTFGHEDPGMTPVRVGRASSAATAAPAAASAPTDPVKPTAESGRPSVRESRHVPMEDRRRIDLVRTNQVLQQMRK